MLSHGWSVRFSCTQCDPNQGIIYFVPLPENREVPFLLAWSETLMNRVDLIMWKLVTSVLVSSYSLFGCFCFRKTHFSYASLYVCVNQLVIFKQNIFYCVAIIIVILIIHYALLSNSIHKKTQEPHEFYEWSNILENWLAEFHTRSGKGLL